MSACMPADATTHFGLLQAQGGCAAWRSGESPMHVQRMARLLDLPLPRSEGTHSAMLARLGCSQLCSACAAERAQSALTAAGFLTCCA